jgi:MerR family mercuric resistance operon transcriptional regulator
MHGRYTISQLARAAGVPTTTVRYYERVGLVHPEDRSEGNYRLYSDASLRKLKFIRAAQAVGFTLDDVKSLLAAPGPSASACRQVQRLIEDRLTEVAQRLRDLRHVQQVLKSALARCRQHEHSGVCHVLWALQEKTRQHHDP